MVNQAAECEESNEESSDEDSEQESKDESAIPDKEKRKSRIIAAFEDSDEEVLEKESKANETKTVERTTTEELFSTLEGRSIEKKRCILHFDGNKYLFLQVMRNSLSPIVTISKPAKI